MEEGRFLTGENLGKKVPEEDSGILQFRDKKEGGVEDILEEKLEDRKEKYLHQFGSEDIKKRQMQTDYKLRKKHREKMFEKRRGYEPIQEEKVLSSKSAKYDKEEFTLNDMQKLMVALCSADPEQVLYGAVGFRKLLCQAEYAPIQFVIDSGIIPRMIQLIGRDDLPHIQYEVAWSLTNIATGNEEQTFCLIEKGAISRFVMLLSSSYDNLKDQSMWALGNLAGDNAKSRDLVIKAGILNPLLKILSHTKKPAMLKNGTWCLANLCRNKPQVNFMDMSPALPVLVKRLEEETNQRNLGDILWSLSYLMEGGEFRIAYLIKSGGIPRLIEIMKTQELKLAIPALRIIGSIVTGTDEETSYAVQAGAILGIMAMLKSSVQETRKEAAWVASNITAGTSEQLQQCIDSGLILNLIQIIQSDHYEVKREAIWGLSNATANADKTQLAKLIDDGAVGCLSGLLTLHDPRILAVILEGLSHLLKQGKVYETNGINPIALRLEENSGLDMLEKLQLHPNVIIHKKAIDLLESYFGTEEDDNLFTNDPNKEISIFDF